jgi:hypothetical protein
VRPIADHVMQSRAIQAWIAQKEPDADRIAACAARSATARSCCTWASRRAPRFPTSSTRWAASGKRNQAAKDVEELTRKRDALRGRKQEPTPPPRPMGGRGDGDHFAGPAGRRAAAL